MAVHKADNPLLKLFTCVMVTGIQEGGARPVGVRERFFPTRRAAPPLRDIQAEGIATCFMLRIGKAKSLAVAVHFYRGASMVAGFFSNVVPIARYCRNPASYTSGHEHLRWEWEASKGQQPASLRDFSSSPLIRRNHLHDPAPVQRINLRSYQLYQQVPILAMWVKVICRVIVFFSSLQHLNFGRWSLLIGFKGFLSLISSSLSESNEKPKPKAFPIWVLMISSTWS